MGKMLCMCREISEACTYMLATEGHAWKPERSEQETTLNITAIATLTQLHVSHAQQPSNICSPMTNTFQTWNEHVLCKRSAVILTQQTLVHHTV